VDNLIRAVNIFINFAHNSALQARITSPLVDVAVLKKQPWPAVMPLDVNVNKALSGVVLDAVGTEVEVKVPAEEITT
jgi:hypothetical protein